jgi:hypothetical protein
MSDPDTNAYKRPLQLLRQLPLKARLQVKSQGITSTQEFVQRFDAIAKIFHDIWERIQLRDDLTIYGTSSWAFFSWNDSTVLDGLHMAYSGLLSAKHVAKPQLGFEMQRIIHSLDGSSFVMDRIFYQVQPVRKTILLEHIGD